MRGFISVCAFGLASCSESHRTAPTQGSDGVVVDETNAVKRAIMEANSRGWTNAEPRVVQKAGEDWQVFLIRLPATPGGHAIVSVNTNGNVKWTAGR